MTLKELREENEKSRAELAAALGVTVTAICQYERGMRRIGLEQILTLSNLYNCNAEEVISAQLESISVRTSQ